jgi:hypothetical protein
LFAEDIFGFFGELPINHGLVPKVVIPTMFAIARKTFPLMAQADKIGVGATMIVCNCSGIHLNRILGLFLCQAPWRFPDGYGVCSDGPLPREMRFSCRRRCSCVRR